MRLSHQGDLPLFEQAWKNVTPGKAEQPIQGMGLGYKATCSHPSLRVK